MSRPADSAKMFASLERRIRHLQPGLEELRFTHHWGGPILFREDWTPVFSIAIRKARTELSLARLPDTAWRFRFISAPGPPKPCWAAAICRPGAASAEILVYVVNLKLTIRPLGCCIQLAVAGSSSAKK